LNGAGRGANCRACAPLACFRTPVSIDVEEIMPFAHWTAAAVFAALPLVAAAQEKNPSPAPDYPHARVPAPVYRSAFQDYRSTADNDTAPDKIWRAANKEVQELGGHAGHLKDTAESPPSPTPGMHHHGKAR
jgi:hypothetical protein